MSDSNVATEWEIMTAQPESLNVGKLNQAVRALRAEIHLLRTGQTPCQAARPVPAAALAREFLDYCIAAPDLRFWQALNNWSGVSYIFAGTSPNPTAAVDTYNWKGKRA